ncbi:gustatory receptor for sugar taste 64d-like isoform X1 [Thrips palmi]|uniref:Gustatory receptor n=1 Tax=Thrips palmi TaxID=161013 RepID=A0A6P8Y9I4_THRPL|nr:gustatory receptor for sugar taste 64d-like isoform X1 [Thrips palmi]
MSVHHIPIMAKKVLSARHRPGNVVAVQPVAHVGPWKHVAESLSDDELLLSTAAAQGSFRALTEHLVASGCYFGVLPAPRDALLTFRWRSAKVFLSVVVAWLLACRILIYFYCVYVGYNTVLEIVVSTRLGFHAMAVMEVAVYVSMACRWRDFVLCFLRVEHRYDASDRFAGSDGKPVDTPSALRKKIVTLAVTALVMSSTEILLELFTYPLSKEVDQFDSFSEMLEDYYNRLFNNVAQAIAYHPVVLVVAQLTVIATNLVLNFNDVFLMSVSFTICRRFHELRTTVSRDAQQVASHSYWQLARENFSDLSELTRKVDHYISFLMLLSCLNNFFSICIQLQHTVRPSSATPGIVRQLYFCFSFAFVLLRFGAMVFAASSIPEETKAIKRALYSVPSAHFSEEIGRFLSQATTDDVTLTGLGLFTITRSFILTMLGSIATYEILLVQMYKSDNF